MRAIKNLNIVLWVLGVYCMSLTDTVANPGRDRIRLVVFGGSESDTGNYHAVHGIPESPNFEGRYSNGPVWIEYLAGDLDIDDSAVRNYAIVGAGTGHLNSTFDNCRGADNRGLQDQLDAFVQDRGDGLRIDADTIFAIWIGANDFEASTEDKLSIGPNAVREILSTIETLHEFGAHRILVANLPDLGKTPRVRGYDAPVKRKKSNGGRGGHGNQNQDDEEEGPRGGRHRGNPNQEEDPCAEDRSGRGNRNRGRKADANTEYAALATTGTVLFNTNLAWALAGMQEQFTDLEIVLWDVFSFFNSVHANPTEFGLTSVSEPCFPPNSEAACAEPDGYIFWDDIHPTTAAHRLLAVNAASSLARGGAPLPDLTCPADRWERDVSVPTVFLTSPTGQFTTDDKLLVAGYIDGTSANEAVISVNGVSIPVAIDGTFETDVDINPDDFETPVVAQLSVNGEIKDRDRIVVFRGDSIALGEDFDDSVLATLTRNGVPEVADEIIYEISRTGALNLAQYIPNPLAGDFGGTVRYIVNPTFIGYGCALVNAELHNGFTRLKFSLRDILVNYHFHGWLEDIPDPGLDCDGGFYASDVSVWMDVKVTPRHGGRTGEVDVTPITPLQFGYVNFQHNIYDCDLDAFGIISGIADQKGDEVGQKVITAIRNYISNPSRSNGLAQEFEEIIAGISISRPVSEAAGVAVSGDIQGITQTNSQVDVWFTTAVSSDLESDILTYAPNTLGLRHREFDPAGEPFDFAVSVSLAALNQLLLARSNALLHPYEVFQVVVGEGILRDADKVLPVLFPPLSEIDLDAELALRVTPTLPPMLLDQSSDSCDGVPVLLSSVVVELVSRVGRQESVELKFMLDVRGCADVGYHSRRRELTVRVAIDPVSGDDIVVTANRLCLDESALDVVLQGLFAILAERVGAEMAKFPLPDLGNVAFVRGRTYADHGYLSLFFEAKAEHGWAHLSISDLVAPPDLIGGVGPRNYQVVVSNTGSTTHPSAPITVCLNGFCQTKNVTVPGNSETSVTFALPTPAAFGNRGQSNRFPITACVDERADCDSADNCRTESLSVAVPWWDLQFEIVDPPKDAPACGSTGWKVRVKNVGNAPSMNVCAMTGIGLHSGPDSWADNLGLNEFTTPQIGAGSTWTHTVSNYQVWCNASVRRQFIKAEINYTAGCFDLFAAGNFNEIPVEITAAPYWDLRFEIIDEPSSARRCGQIDWKVRVKNVGTMKSPRVCAITGINCSPGPGAWGCNLGLDYFRTPEIAPGASWTHRVDNYNVWCDAFPGTQYIKTEINYSAGCYDLFTAGNFNQEALRIN